VRIHHVLVKQTSIEHQDNKRGQNGEVNANQPADSSLFEGVIQLEVVPVDEVLGETVANQSNWSIQQHEHSVPTNDFVEDPRVHVQELLTEESKARHKGEHQAVEKHSCDENCYFLAEGPGCVLQLDVNPSHVEDNNWHRHDLADKELTNVVVQHSKQIQKEEVNASQLEFEQVPLFVVNVHHHLLHDVSDFFASEVTRLYIILLANGVPVLVPINLSGLLVFNNIKSLVVFQLLLFCVKLTCVLLLLSGRLIFLAFFDYI
jgi:hypothetical protein